MTKNPIPFRVIEVICSDFKLGEDVGENDVMVETEFSFSVNVSAHRVRSIAHYQYIQNEKVSMALELICTFEVQEDAFNDMIHDDVFTLTANFAQYLTTINVGAARGEIHARCEAKQSKCAKIILPPINLVKILPENVKIDISTNR